MVKRLEFSKEQRQLVRKRQGNCCNLCGCEFPWARSKSNPNGGYYEFHCDHTRALVDGGQTSLRNAQALCYGCHWEKTAQENSLRSSGLL